MCYPSQSSTVKILHSRKVMVQGSPCENVCAWRCCFFFFCFFVCLLFFLLFFAIWSPIFSSSLSISLLFCRPFLSISYAGPFEPCLTGVNGAALHVWRYNGKPNIFGPKIWLFFIYIYTLQDFHALPLHARGLVFTHTSVLNDDGTEKFAVRVVQKVLDSNYA